MLETETMYNILHPRAGYISPEIPEVHPQMDWAANLAMNVGGGFDQLADTGNKIKAVGSAALSDMKNANMVDRAVISLSGVAFTANLLQVRTIGTAQLELMAYNNSGPAAVIAAGIGVHLLYFGTYGELFSRGVQKSPKVTEALAEIIPAEKVDLFGLKPGSMAPPDRVQGNFNRACSRLGRHGGRSFFGKAGISLYIALAEMQGQSKRDQAHMRWGMLAEGAALSVVNSVAVAGAMSSLGPEFVYLYNYAPLVAITAGKQVYDRLKKERALPETETKWLPSEAVAYEELPAAA